MRTIVKHYLFDETSAIGNAIWWMLASTVRWIMFRTIRDKYICAGFILSWVIKVQESSDILKFNFKALKMSF